MEEALVALGVFWALLNRQQRIEFLADEDGVAHLALGGARMHVAALDMDLRGCCVEVLELQFSRLTAIHGISIFGVEPGHVELHNAAPDLLVGSETDTDGAVLELGMSHDVLHRVHDFGDTGLVVGAEKRRAVGGDDGLAHMAEQFREFGRLQSQPGHTLEGDVGSVIILDYLGFDILAGSVGSGIHMGDESHGGHIVFHIRRDASHDVSVFIELRFYSKLIQFLAQEFQQVQLLARGGLALRILVAPGVDCHVPQKSVQNLFHLYLFLVYS